MAKIDSDMKIALAVEKERKRAIGLVLAEFGRQKLGGEFAFARVLDTLAIKIEAGDES